MADRPEISGAPNYYEWASSVATQVVVKNGKVLNLDNKRQPLPEFTTFGLRFKQPLNFQEINYQLNGNFLWFQHLDERYSIGDVHKTTSGEDQPTISARLGGTWAFVGVETVAAVDIDVWEKTA